MNGKLTLAEIKLQLCEHNIAALIKKKAQSENQLKTALSCLSAEKRRERASRLIKRGAIAESLIPEAKSLTNEQVQELLVVALQSSEAREYLDKVAVEPSLTS